VAVEVFTAVVVDSTEAEDFMGAAGSTAEDSTVAEAFAGEEGDFVAALPVAGTMVTAVGFAEEPPRAQVIRMRMGELEGTPPVRLETPLSVIDFDPVQVA
jgi:hypothetical protein